MRCNRRRKNGEPCKGQAVTGTNVCRMHGGSAPQVRAKATERRIEADARKQLAKLDVQPVTDPLAVLAELAGQAVAFKDQLAERVNELRAVRFEDAKGAEQLRSEVALWERALDRCEKFAHNLARLNLDERLVRIEEQQQKLVLDAIEAALTATGLGVDERAAARQAAARELRAVA